MNARPRFQTHSEDLIGRSGPTLTSEILSHRRRPVPRAEMGPGLHREDEDERIALNHSVMHLRH